MHLNLYFTPCNALDNLSIFLKKEKRCVYDLVETLKFRSLIKENYDLLLLSLLF